MITENTITYQEDRELLKREFSKIIKQCIGEDRLKEIYAKIERIPFEIEEYRRMKDNGI